MTGDGAVAPQVATGVTCQDDAGRTLTLALSQTERGPEQGLNVSFDHWPSEDA